MSSNSGGLGWGGFPDFPAFQHDQPMTNERKTRLNKIEQFLPVLQLGAIPRLNDRDIQELLKDLKEEGNAVFREKDYQNAGQLYTYALQVGKHMESSHIPIERQYLSTLFSNRAACFIKMDLHKKGVEDCDFAISLNNKNIKAYYRKATALKSERQFQEAHQVAKLGRHLASEQDRKSEVSQFEELIKELQCHLPSSASTLSSTGKPAAARNGKKRGDSGVDEAWLQGTNVQQTQKSMQQSSKAKATKQKKSATKPTIPRAARNVAMDESDESSSSDDSDSGSSSSTFMGGGIVKTSNPYMVLAAGSASPAKNNTSKPQVTAPQTLTKKSNNNGMGLDDFGMRELAKSLPQVKLSKVLSTAPTPPAAVQASGRTPNVQVHVPLQGPPAPNSSPSEIAPMVSRHKLPYPFGSKYMFTLACNICYQRTETFPKEFCQYPAVQHQCSCDILLVKLKLESNVQWMKIRARNTKVNFLGSYRLCQQAQYGRDCKVDEMSCSFAHNTAELDLWTMDRDEQICLEDFKADQRAKLSNGLSWFDSTNKLTSAPAPEAPPVYSTKQLPQFLPAKPAPLQMLHQPQPVQVVPSSQATPINSPASGQQLVFPLKDTHSFRLVCEKCLCMTGDLGVYVVQTNKHECDENILVVGIQGQPLWVKVRERKNHRVFRGDYVLCFHRCGTPPRRCHHNEDCHYAHNIIEQMLWTLEKAQAFSITEFILQNRSVTSAPGFTSNDFFGRHEGYFIYLCHSCFFSHPRRIILQDKKRPDRCASATHVWENNKLLVHVDLQNALSPILARPFTYPGAFYLMCRNLQYCPRRQKAMCKFAHSFVERNVWMLERDAVMNRDDLVTKSQQLLMKGQQPAASQQQLPTAASIQPRIRTMSSSSSAPSESDRPLCPHRVVEICNICWRQGKKSPRDGKRDRCSGKEGHQWQINRLYLLLPSNKIIRALPKRIPANNRFLMCNNIAKRGTCDYARGSMCQFAHSSEEIDVWCWMVNNNVSDLAELARVSEESNQTRSKAAKPISRGQSVVESQPVQASPSRGPFNLDMAANTLHCQYCSVFCNSSKQWDEHCASARHMFNVNSDKEHQWNCRQPPWGVSQDNYRLCAGHAEGRCRYSTVPDMYNLCRFAHSHEELDEWKERYEWRQMKREIAQQEGVYSYMEALLEDYHSAPSGIEHLSEEVAGVAVQCSSPLRLYQQNKHASQSWIFTIKSASPLQKVALLLNQDRLHFSLVGEQVDNDHTTQIAPGDSFMLQQQQHTKDTLYSVHVQFTGGVFGSFIQWIGFDFGSRPVLVRKLGVELGNQFVQEKVQGLRQKLDFVRWTLENRVVVKASTNGEKEEYSQALMQYKAPAAVDDVITQQSLKVNLNRHNYVHKMHKLLHLEELTQARVIASYNVKTSLEMLRQFQEETLVVARQGELFAKVPLNGQLSEDTNAGKLILTSVMHVLLGLLDSKDTHVYEADIVQKSNFDYDGRGRDFIYLCFPKHTCEALSIDAGDRLQVEIQFQMDRRPFARMHLALDSLPSTDVLFPDVMKQQSTMNNREQLHITSSVLNSSQLEIVRHALLDNESYIPPLVVHGSFGTGKTETLAQASMILMKQRPNTRLLICTLSNSAADLYILKHLDAFVSNTCPNVKLLRVYYKERRVNTVDPVVRKYCLFDANRSSFDNPREADIQSANIVITTVHTSLIFKQIGIADGFFSHIFIDEAGQALECEAIMPLTLATPSTCVILAGDHMQMSPKVYSLEAKHQSLHRSLLERLYRHYEAHEAHMKGITAPKVVLSDNYRTKMEILRFISTIFYGGPSRLTCRSDQATPDSLVPLTFYVAQGEEHVHPESTSYHNRAEVEEVVERVDELFTNWPTVEWGERRPEFIGVVAPYTDQVIEIRKALRRKRRELGGVVVERVMNVQGKEFRAVFVSTVRTLHLLDHPPSISPDSAECDGDMGDFGFLSDQKLLNTVFTRAQSLVAVIGEPVALCAIGECTGVWRTFLKHCSKMNSIQPSSVTLEGIRQQVLGLMQSPRGQNLNRVQDESAAGNEPSLQPSVSKVTRVDRPAVGLFESVTTQGRLVNLKCVVSIAASNLLEQIAVEVDSGKQDRSSQIQVVRWKGFAVAHATGCDDNLMRSILVPLGEGREEKEEADVSREELERLLEKEANVFRCFELYKECGRAWGRPVGDQPGGRVQLGTWSDSVSWQVGDVVVAELLDHSPDSAPQGIILGVYERAQQPADTLIVCTLHPDAPGLLVPRDPAIRPLLMLANKNRFNKMRKGSVAVYTLTESNQLSFHHYEEDNAASVLYIVRYVEWNASLNKPLGLVLGVLPKQDTLALALASLRLQHKVVESFLPETEAEIEKSFHADYTLPAESYLTRLDYRERVTFSIEERREESGIQCAYSFDEIQQDDGSTTFLVGVHVVDVTQYVSEGSAIDQEAAARGHSFSCPNQPRASMLPDRLSKQLCNFQLGVDKPALSFFIAIDSAATVQQLVPQRSTVNLKHLMSFSQIDNVLVCPEDVRQTQDKHLVYSILMLQRITQMWRKTRLGNEAQLPSPQGYTAVRHLVEELDVTIGHQVAVFLLGQLPYSTPLLTQAIPNPLHDWQAKYLEAARCSIALTRPYKFRGEVCQCPSVCDCLPSPTPPGYMKILPSVWEALNNSCDISEQVNLILNPNQHPLTAIAQFSLNQLHQTETYDCSANLTDVKRYYYKHNLRAYLPVTDPLNSYMDLVAHRLVISRISEVRGPVKSMKDVADLCSHLNGVMLRHERYTAGTADAVHRCQLRHEPKWVYAVVSGMAEQCLTIQCPRLNGQELVLNTANMALSSLTTDEEGACTLTWERRVYDLAPPTHLIGSNTDVHVSNSPIDINPACHVVQIPLVNWQNIVLLAGSGVAANVTQAVHQAEQAAILPKHPRDATCEVENVSMGEYCVHVHMNVLSGQVVKVQLTASAAAPTAMLSPKVQLLHLTDSLAVCVEHQADPAQCFAPLPLPAGSVSYKSLVSYQRDMAALLGVEAAVRVVSDNSSMRFTVHHVNISWQNESEPRSGSFTLPTEFCRDRRIGVVGGCVPASGPQEPVVGYVCIIYPNTRQEESPLLVEFGGSQAGYHVTHGLLTQVEGDPRQETYHVQLPDTSQPPPKHVLQPATTCSVELIVKDPLLRSCEEVLVKLEDAGALARAIVAHTDPQPLDGSYTKALQKHSFSINSKVHSSQKKAVESALTQPFTVITAPPGGGKTHLAALLAAVFVQVNQGEQVMLCAANEEALDVLTDAVIDSLDSSPGNIVRFQGDKSNGCGSHSDITLHHLVVTQSSLARQLSSLEKRGSSASPAYRDMMEQAKREVITAAKILLTTCADSAAPCLTENSNVHQLLIDDCNSCMEAECLIPIISSQCQHIILLGNAKSLQPHVCSSEARHRGLEKSLLERYSKDAVFIDVQFRMHASLASFPFQHYHGRYIQYANEDQTKTSPLKLWPGSRADPFCFIHVLGHEEEMLPSGGDTEKSLLNKEEVSHTVRIAAQLIRRFHVSAASVAVLTPYEAQAAAMRTSLQQRGENLVTVSTFPRSQGREWDYVLLSMVRSSPVPHHLNKSWCAEHLGRVSDPHLMEMALTRARKGLIIIGDHVLLRCDKMWGELLEDYSLQNKVVSAPDFLTK